MNGGFIGTFTDISIYQCLSFPRAFEVFSESYLSNILRRLDPDLVELWVGIILEHSELDPKASLNRDSLPSIHKLRFSPVCFSESLSEYFSRSCSHWSFEHPFSSMALAWTWTCMSAAFRLAGSLTNTNWFFEVSDRLRYFDELICSRNWSKPHSSTDSKLSPNGNGNPRDFFLRAFSFAQV